MKNRRVESTMRKLRVLVILLCLTVLFIIYQSYRQDNGVPIKAENVLMLDDLGQKLMKQLKAAKLKRPLDNSAPRLLLLSQFRTGSTLVGEIFNKNPEMFYLWEPLVCIPHNGTLLTSSFAKFLSHICNCEFSEASASCLGNQREVQHSRSVNAICRRVTGIHGVECPLATQNSFHTQCAKNGGKMAMKVTQIDLEQLHDLVEESNFNIKILHLVRDPRGTASSRQFFMMTEEEQRSYKKSIVKGLNGTMSLKQMGYFDDLQMIPDELRIDQLCEWTHLNLQTALRQPDWLQNRYMLLRIEDFIQNPSETTRNIYSFIGAPAPLSVVEWIGNLEIVTSSEEVSQLSNEESIFFPRKNLQDIATKWRRYTHFSDVIETQKVCGDVMKMLGYDFIESEETLRNIEIDVMTDIPYDIKMKLGWK